MDTPRLIGGRYRLLEALGSGGMGTVWRATDERLHRAVAIKQVQAPPGLSDEERRLLTRRTLREARAAAAISSPSVVTIFDVVDDDMPWIVMELLHARTLSQVISEEGPLPVPEVARIGLALLDGLEAAHAAGVVHRDVKPSNVMIDDRGVVVLTDFGAAALDGDATLTTSGAIIGSPAYLAPERARGERAAPPSDLWSLGATLYTAVEGRTPFHREGQLATLAAVMNDEPAPMRHAGPLAPVLTALLTKNPADRPGLDEVRSELADVAAGRIPTPGAGARQATSQPRSQTTSRSTSAPGASPATPPTGTDAIALDQDQRTEVLRLAPAPGAVPPSPRTPTPAPPPPDVAARGRRGGPILALVAALVLVAAFVAGLLALSSDDAADAGSDPGATADAPAGTASPGSGDADTAAARSGGPEPARSPGAGAAASPTATTPTGRTGTASPASPAPSQDPPADQGLGAVARPGQGTVPAGYRTYTDPAGWSVAVPEGWREVRDGPRIDFRAPDGAFLRIDSTDTPAGDPLTDWENQEQGVSQRLNGYQRISLERVEYRGWSTADWRFAFDGDRNRIRVLNRNFVVDDSEAHALYYSAPESVYDESVHAVAAATFTPS